MPRSISLTVNGKKENVKVEDNQTLSGLLRDQLGLTGTKTGCEEGECGSCTILLDGKPVNSCLVLATSAENKKVTTIEGLSSNGKLHPLQQAFVNKQSLQCGYCSPGMILSAKALLDSNPKPTEDQIKNALKGNFCRCGMQQRIVSAVRSAAGGKVK